MAFQSSVRDVQTTGIVGEIIVDGPQRGESLIIDSAGATPNTIGKAYTRIAGSDDKCAAGSAGGGAFAGILANPKTQASYGSASGTLAPTLDIPDNASGELMTMCTMVVDLSAVGTGAIGEGIFYVNATGLLGSGTAGAGQTQIANAKIARKNVTAPGLAIITMTEAE